MVATFVGYGIDIAEDVNHIGVFAPGSIVLQGIYHRIGNLAVGGYLYGLEETVTVVALVGNSIDISGDVNDIRVFAPGSIVLQGIYYAIGNLAVAGYLYGLEETIATGTFIGYGIDISGDVNNIGLRTINNIKLQGVDDAAYIPGIRPCHSRAHRQNRHQQ